MTNYWVPIEAQWQQDHCEALSEHVAITQLTHQLVADIAQHPDLVDVQGSKSVIAARLLVRRLGEELRAVELLATCGHGFQAATAACNLFEQSHFLTYVNENEENANRFLGWTNPHKSPMTIRDLVNQSGLCRGWSQDRCDAEYDKYSFLCGFKHNNPVFQGILRLPSDPDLWMGQYALAESLSCVLSAVGLLAAVKLKLHNTKALVERCNTLLERVQLLFPRLDSGQ